MNEVVWLSAQLKARRSALELTQQALATGAGLSVSMVFQLEQGKKTNPCLKTLRSLACVLGCRVADLLTPPPEQPPDRPRGRKRKGGDA